MYEYRKGGAGYQYIDGSGAVVYDGVAVAICFDKRASVLLRHGDPEVVRRCLSQSVASYCASGYPDMAADLVMLTSSEWDVDLLNRAIGIADYTVRMVRTLGIALRGPVGDVMDDAVGRPGTTQASPEEMVPPFKVEVTQFIPAGTAAGRYESESVVASA